MELALDFDTEILQPGTALTSMSKYIQTILLFKYECDIYP